MDIEKNLTEEELKLILAEKRFQKDLLVKDYYLTILLYLLKDVKEIYFKGGTALQKTVLDYSRLSEDIDFTIETNLVVVRGKMISVINKSDLFGEISFGKDVNGFVRLIVPYKTKLGQGELFIDLNERGKLFLKPEKLELKHFYPNIPQFSFPCLSKEEIVAEKVAAAIGRNKPRDHYDIYQIIKHNIPINMSLVKKKCQQSGDEFNITKMFNKAQTLYKRWNEDLEPLNVEEVTFQEVMQTLAKHFKLKVEKDKFKKK